MSQHLWLYEGTTEYFSTLAPLHDSTIKEEGFRRQIEGKLKDQARLPDDFSFTEFSRNVLSAEGQDLYPIVYTYGAVNAFYLDILIRESSGGSKGLLDVIYRMREDFGPSRPFQDDSLFALIGKETSPTIRNYLETYVKGTKRIPSSEILSKIGWKYTAEKINRVPGYGIGMQFTMQGDSVSAKIQPTSPENPLNVMDGDELIRVEGIALNKIQSTGDGTSLLSRLRSPKIGDSLKITVKRNGKELDLSGVATTVNKGEKHIIEIDANPTPAQAALRRAVFYE
ncbi:MAG: PDZ domain-containing protein [Candidatus Kapabacteria bacterium]|nr:PDZ domain-containing protein [Candidatus Kapabacteria bacterium]